MRGANKTNATLAVKCLWKIITKTKTATAAAPNESG